MKQTDASPEIDSPRAVDRTTEKRILEALIFIADAPLTVEQISQVLTGRSPGEIRELVEELENDLCRSERALRVEEVAGGYQFATRPDLAPWVRVHFKHRNRTRLSAAGVETLAVIAYKQPITAPEVQEIRGVDSQGAIRTLLEKRLIRAAGRKKVVGRPFLYATSKEFLMHFGLASIEDLPPIEDFERLASELAATGEGSAGAEEARELVSSDEIEGAGLSGPLPGEGADLPQRGEDWRRSDRSNDDEEHADTDERPVGRSEEEE